MRLFLCASLILCLGLSTAFAKDAPKEAPKKPACEKKEQAKKAPLTAEQKAELAKKRAEAVEKMFAKRDLDKDGKLTLEELKGKAKKPEAAARAEKLLKAKDKDGDGALTKEEMLAKPERKKKAGKKKAEKQQ